MTDSVLYGFWKLHDSCGIINCIADPRPCLGVPINAHSYTYSHEYQYMCTCSFVALLLKVQYMAMSLALNH